MFLTLLVEAVLGGTVEVLAGAGIEKTPELAKRIQRAVDLVERQQPSAVEAAIQAAVEAARVDLLAAFADDLYSGDADAVTRDMIALLNHPPFAEEVARKLLYRGQPDFAQLRFAYLKLPDTQDDGRWAALEFPLLDFFDAIERHLQADERVGPLLRGLQQVVTLSRLESSNQIVADASVQIQVSLTHLEKTGAETADGIQQLIALSHEQNATLRDVALFLRENAGRHVHTNGGAYFEGDANIGGDLVNGDKITHIYHVYQSAPGQPILDEAGFTAAVSRYLQWVRNRYGQLNLRGVQRRERQALTLTLEDVYVSLQAMVTPKRNERHRAKKTEMPAEQTEPQTVDMAQLLALGERLAIIGGPGSGKTTFLHIIASALAHALLTDEIADVQHYLGLEKELPLPIFVTLSDYNRYRRQCENTANHDARQGTLTAFISHSLIRQEAALGGLPADFFERLLGQGKRCIVLLDGLDEVADERERMLVRQAVENLAANQGVGQMLVTSRTRAFQGRSMLSEEFRVAQVQPMTLEQAQALAGRWCWAVYDETRATEQSVRLQDAIASLEAMRERRGESPLVDSPLMVTIVAIVHYNDRRLPDERADLYTRCVDVLLAESYKPESQATFELVDWGGNERDKRSLLAYLAFCMMSAGEESGRSADADQISAWLLPPLMRSSGEAQAKEAVEIFLQAMCERGSLIDERGGRYQFIHLQAFPFWNHPRENVTWYQAIAFCRWLTEKAKTEPALLPPEARSGAWRITLPTEWQWEKAARGHDGRTYPWGNEYISGYANVDETENKDGPYYLHQTSAVGLYPQGASPYGILDLSGNLWEWCLNEYREPERFQEKGDERRVLRGGSWLWNVGSAKASSRAVRLPDFGYNLYGFRCVVVPITHG